MTSSWILNLQSRSLLVEPSSTSDKHISSLSLVTFMIFMDFLWKFAWAFWKHRGLLYKIVSIQAQCSINLIPYEKIWYLFYKKNTNISNIWCGLILIFRIMKIWEFARYLHNFVTFFIISRPLYLLSFHKTSLYVCNFPGYTYFCECTYSNLEVILKTFYFSPRLSLHYLVIWTTTQFCFLYFVRQ